MRPPKRPLFAANWKMHLGPGETTEFVRAFAEAHPPREDATVVFFPASVSLSAFGVAAAGRPDLEFGVQDVHTETSGPHTGAISAEMVPQTGGTWGLAGHSERRREFKDADAAVAAKVSRLLDAGLQPILCVGESLEERQAGALEGVLDRQVSVVLESLEETGRRALVYAYEPVWAIGTGRTASPSDAAEAHSMVRAAVARAVDADNAERAIILYGGSVKAANIDELLAASGVDGVLVGGASLEAQSFADICAGGAS